MSRKVNNLKTFLIEDRNYILGKTQNWKGGELMKHATIVAGSCHPNSYGIKEAAALLKISLVMNFSPAAAFQPIGYCCAS